jgi:acylglycerol lipase
MGCGNSAIPKEEVDIAPRCEADGVKFEEKFETINGERRNTASWVPAGGQVKAVVFICHGLLEHSLCYYQIAIPLALDGYAILGIDHCSHGKSTGTRGVIDDHTVLYKDFTAFCNEERAEYNGLPRFVLAHSLGCLIALVSIPQIRDLTAVAFSGAAMVPGSASASPFGLTFLYPLTKTAAAGPITSLTGWADPKGPASPLKAEDVIWDLEEVDFRAKDPRRLPPFITNKTANSALKLQKEAKMILPKIVIPFLAFHGSEDKVCLPVGSEIIFAQAGTDPSQKRLEILAGLKHETLQESRPQSDYAITMVTDFFNGRLSGSSCGGVSGDHAVVTAESDTTAV